jgi:hypothetical protein
MPVFALQQCVRAGVTIGFTRVHEGATRGWAGGTAIGGKRQSRTDSFVTCLASNHHCISPSYQDILVKKAGRMESSADTQSSFFLGKGREPFPRGNVERCQLEVDCHIGPETQTHVIIWACCCNVYGKCVSSSQKGTRCSDMCGLVRKPGV